MGGALGLEKNRGRNKQEGVFTGSLFFYYFPGLLK